MTKTYIIEITVPKTSRTKKREIQEVLKLNGFTKTFRWHAVWRLKKEMEQGTWSECLHQFLQSMFNDVSGITFSLTGEFKIVKNNNLKEKSSGHFNSRILFIQ